ncbi:MAG: NAD(P)H-hydrate dehydratase [Candidatus Baltobacteraceae bacterium]
MIAVLTPQEMRDADAEAVRIAGATQLMRNAGRRIAEVLCEALDAKSVVAFAGPGNNGGDAFAAFADLREMLGDIPCTIYARDDGVPSEARRDAEERARAAGVTRKAFPQSFEAAMAALVDATTVVDALFGTGARLPVEEPYASAIRAMNACGKPILAADIPSGIDALSGAVDKSAVRAAVTLTLGALKPGLLLDPARDHVGTLFLGSIGIPHSVLHAPRPQYAALDDHSFAALLPLRPPNGDKRSSGAPFIIAGSRQFPGAAVLCAKAAARTGAGYVTVATPANAAATLRMHLIEQVVTELAEDASADEIIDQLLDTARHCSAIGIGPGLGLDERTGEIVRGFLRKTELPFVADASALFHFAKNLDILDTPRAVITPHAREFARLSGKGTLAPEQRVERLREFVDRTHCTTLLKGRTTLIYDGTTMHMNCTGTSALATAGTGDILTGMIATLLSQGLLPVDAARAAAYWHGLAAQYCERGRSRGVMAGDLPDALAAVIPEQFVSDDQLRAILGAH